MAKRLFGTDGIRGVAGEPPLDPKTVFALGIALGIIIFLRREKYRVIPPGDAHRRAV